MRNFAVAAVFVFVLPCAADEIQLKDGKVISWKSISDDGTYYTAETADGSKVKIKKTDVEKFIVSSEKSPLIGASFAIDKKKAVVVDITLKAAVKGDESIGPWKFSNGTLSGSASGEVRSRTPFELGGILPEEYDISLVAESKSFGDQFAFGFVVGQRQFAFHFDAFNSTMSCMAFINGANGDAIPGQVFTPGKPRAIRFMVRKEAFIVQVDGKDLWTWKADWEKVSLCPVLAMKSKEKPFIAVVSGTWKFSSVSVSFVK